MKKNAKALIGCAVAVALAGGAYAAVTLTEKTPETSSVADSVIDENNVPVKLFAYEKTDVEYVTVSDGQGKELYKAYPDGEDESGNILFTVEGIEDLDVNTTLTASLLTRSSELQSDQTAEKNPADLAKYGLDKPLYSIKVKAAGEEKTILVGDKSPVDDETYCMEKDGDSVYLVSTTALSVFLNEKDYFVSTTLLEKPADEVYPKIESVKVERTDIDYDILLEYDKNADTSSTSGSLALHCMTQPKQAYLDGEKSSPVTHGMFGLTAKSIIAIHPDEATIAGSGLAEPFCTVTMIADDEQGEYVLRIGNKIDIDGTQYYSVMYNDNDVIYAISAEDLVWADVVPADIISRLVFGVYVWDIGTLEVNVNGGESVVFEGNGTGKDDYVVTKNGEACDTERFRKFYTFLLETAAEDFVIDEQPSGEMIASINLETQDGNTVQNVEFYEADGTKVLISVNGTPCFKCRRSYVDLLIENLAKFDTTEEFVMNW